ncbi:NAD-dependent epimerase/dehydratase family protein [Sphingobium bisphenolivorans]|uniref:NAD-dependent epimerase/dehydratase family protein n=1 Tax=Sphingobium bisphenolivorans TaxID=1335760 RepID=UPI0003AAC514|nr:NAD-dependent epimerase/dehydratase family protein [Sphingobium bisphenolivorans]
MTQTAALPIVAVTGATGFTGGALARELVAQGYRVRALARRQPTQAERDGGIEWIVGSMTDAAVLDQLVEGARCCFHVAAMYRTEGSRDEFLEANRESTRLLLAASRAAGLGRFIYCSSIGVHGHVAQTPADEDAPFDPRDPYQESKLLAEAICREEMERPGLDIVIIRPCAIYGPGDTRMLKMFRMVQKRRFFFVGAGQPNFHPVYIDDLVQGFLLAMTSPDAPGKAFIIGGNGYLPLRDYVATAADILQVPRPRVTVPYSLANAAAHGCELLCAPLGVQPPLHRRRLTFFKHNRAFSIARAQRTLGFTPAVDLAEGFRRTVRWYRDQGMLK